MTTYRPVDSKREEYRKFLERAGVMESLTRILVSLYEEQDKGIDALEYVRNHLNENRPTQNSSEEELQAQISRLVAENNMLRQRLSQYEEVPPPMSAAPPSKSLFLTDVNQGQSKASQEKVSGSPTSSSVTEKSSNRQAAPDTTFKD